MTSVVVAGGGRRLLFRADSARRELGAREHQALLLEVRRGTAQLFARREVMDFVKVDGRWRGVIARNLVTGWLERVAGSAVLLGDADPPTLLRAYKRGAPLTFREGAAGILGMGQAPQEETAPVSTEAVEFQEAEQAVSTRLRKLLAVPGSRPAAEFERELERLLSEEPSREVLAGAQALKERFWKEVRVPGSSESFNQALEQAGRVADLIELGELKVRDGLGSGGGSWQYRGERREPLEIHP